MDTQKLGLGHIITSEQQRDAIHVAIAPVTVAMRVNPGEHVGIGSDGKATYGAPHVGVIDPFLKDAVEKGERCWMFLYPGSITSLRHEWTHPAFEAANAGNDPMADSKAWVKNYAETHCPYYREIHKEDAYEGFMKHVNSGEIFYYGSDLHGFGELEEPDELFLHLSRILGRPVNGHSFKYSCSC